MEFLKKLLFVVITALSIGDVFAMDPVPGMNPGQKPSSLRALVNRNQSHQIPAPVTVAGDGDDCVITGSKQRVGPNAFVLPDPGQHPNTGMYPVMSHDPEEKSLARVREFLAHGGQVLYQGGQFVYECVPKTSPGLVKGLLEAGAATSLRWTLDQALGICTTNISAHCPHQGVRWVMLVAACGYGVYSAAHLAKFIWTWSQS